MGEPVARHSPLGSELRLITQHLDRKVGLEHPGQLPPLQLAAPTNPHLDTPHCTRRLSYAPSAVEGGAPLPSRTGQVRLSPVGPLVPRGWVSASWDEGRYSWPVSLSTCLFELHGLHGPKSSPVVTRGLGMELKGPGLHQPSFWRQSSALLKHQGERMTSRGRLCASGPSTEKVSVNGGHTDGPRSPVESAGQLHPLTGFPASTPADMASPDPPGLCPVTGQALGGPSAPALLATLHSRPGAHWSLCPGSAQRTPAVHLAPDFSPGQKPLPLAAHSLEWDEEWAGLGLQLAEGVSEGPSLSPGDSF